MNYLLYNPLANNKHGEESKSKILEELKDKFPNLQAVDYIKTSFQKLSQSLQDGDNVILAGGDGTICHFANDMKKATYPKVNFYLVPAGTGNDFVNDLKDKEENLSLIPMNKYLEHLPQVTYSNGETYYYINNVGFGLDGMVCQVADDQRIKGKKKTNYTTIALSLLLGKFKRPNATVTVDGETKEYKKIWVCPAMNGRFYGGGMMAAPEQDRLSGKITCCIMYGQTRIKTIFAFLGIFKGTHVKHKEMIDIKVGNHIKVTFDAPCAIQIDGEVTRNITGYEAWIGEKPEN